MSDQAPNSGTTDRPNRIPWPPILDACVLVAAFGLQRMWPLPALTEAGWARWLGWAIVAAGIAIALAGVLHFRRIGTPVDPTSRAERLATGGIYAWTRNPMYVGTLVAFAGLALAWPNAWLLLLVPVLGFGMFKLAIVREEAFLERRFGADYRAYKARARRWV